MQRTLGCRNLLGAEMPLIKHLEFAGFAGWKEEQWWVDKTQSQVLPGGQ